MSFISAATAIGLTGIGATIGAGVMMGGATTIGMNLIRGNDPFDNIGQGLLLGGISGGIFGGAGAAAGEGAAATTGATLDAASNVIPAQNLAVTSGNASADLVNKFGGTLDPTTGQPFTNTFGFKPPAEYNYFDPNGPVAQSTFTNNPPYVSDPVAESYKFALQPETPVDPSFGTTVAPPVGATDMPVIQPNAVGGYPKSSSGTSFMDDPFKWMNANKGKTALGAAVAAGAMGAFNPKTGLNNLPPRTYQRVNTSYNPGTVNPKYGMPGEPYFVGQGYGPQTRETFSVAAGGGIRALSGGDLIAPYMSMSDRGGTNKPSPKSLEGSSPFKDYLASTGPNENDDPYAGAADGLKRLSPGALQRIIDGTDTIAAGLAQNELYQRQAHAPISRGDIEGMKKMAEGGLSNLPAAYQQPQYQMSDFANSPLFQPTGGNAPVQPGISEYIANINKYTPPAPVAATTPAVTNTTSPTIYDPATQRYSTNPSYVAPETSGGSTNDSYDLQQGSGGDKAGGPIASKRYAMGGLAALPEYAAGGKLLSGDGDGMSDSIPAVIKGERPQRAALADGEFVIPADVVSHLGNGSTKAGGKRLYEMMANIRKARTGNSKQGKQINPMKFIPA